MTDILPPHRPLTRAPRDYSVLNRPIATEPKTETAAQPNPKHLFTMTLSATRKGGEAMNEASVNEKNFLIKLVFKDHEPGLRLPLEETQLLLAYIGEILRQIEAEEKLIVAEQNAAQKKETTPCK